MEEQGSSVYHSTFGKITKPKIALYVLRGEPIHNGQLALLEDALPVVDQVIIGFGSINKRDRTNFQTFAQRSLLMRRIIRAEHWEDKILKIVGLEDVGNDYLWLRNCERVAGYFNTVITTNPQLIGIFGNMGYWIPKFELRDRSQLMGTHIRDLMFSERWNEVKDKVHPTSLFFLKRFVEDYKRQEQMMENEINYWARNQRL